MNAADEVILYHPIHRYLVSRSQAICECNELTLSMMSFKEFNEWR